MQIFSTYFVKLLCTCILVVSCSEFAISGTSASSGTSMSTLYAKKDRKKSRNKKKVVTVEKIETVREADTLPPPPKPVEIKSLSGKLKAPIIVDPTRTKSRVKSPLNIDLAHLVGRWVSSSRMPDNREAWIIDVALEQNDLRFTLSPQSGIFQRGQWTQGTLLERTSLINIANSESIITSRDDISAETMSMLGNIQSKVSHATIDGNTISFKFIIDLQYVPSAGKYDWLRNLGAGFGSNGSMWGSLLNSTLDNAANSAQANDTQLKYLAEISFQVKITESGLSGTGKELVIEQAVNGEHEKKNRIFTTAFHKVDDYYRGYLSGFTDPKSEEQLLKEKTLVNNVRKLAKNNGNYRYALALLYAYHVGESEDFGLTVGLGKKGYKEAEAAAKMGCPQAQRYLCQFNYWAAIIATSLESRKKYYAQAKKWTEMLEKRAPALAYNCLAKFNLDKSRDYEKCVEYYERAAALDNGSAMNELGWLYQYHYNQPAKAIDYYSSAVKQGNSDAMYNIALMYLNGDGVPEDVVNYFKWLMKAFDAGNPKAAEEIADAYFNGVGVERSYKMGIAYTELSAAMRAEEWKKAVKALVPELEL